MILRALALLLALSSAALAQSGQIPTATVWGNSTASKAIASPATFTAMFDRAFGATGGSLIARSGAAWGLVSGTATARLPLLSGANTTPVWGAYTLPASVTSGGISCFTSTSVAASSVLLTASALVLGGGAGVCPSPLGSLGTTTTLLHGNAAGAPTFGAVVAADVTTNTLTNATLAQAAASTLKGNPTASTANVQDFTITGLTLKSSPAAADEVLLSDSAASNAYKKATVSALTSAASRSYLAGATLSTAGASATFGIAAGVATDSTNVSSMALASAYTKTTSAWALGTAAGSLDTGAIANSTWYHAFLIKRVDTGVVDVLISTSATAPTMPASYTLFRRIGSMKTNGSAQWTKFKQDGDKFLWDVMINDYNVTNPGTSAVTRVVTTPLGVRNEAILLVGFTALATADNPSGVFVTDLSIADTAVIFSLNTMVAYSSSVNISNAASEALVFTDTSAQVRTRLQLSASGTTLMISTHGWVDRRGRDD